MEKKKKIGRPRKRSKAEKDGFTKALKAFHFPATVTALTMKNPYALKLRKVGDKTGKCMWFLKCVRKGTKTLAHPILGDVKICVICLKWCKKHGA